jgi:hypothetical protein
MRIFVSHHHSDAVVASRLGEALAQRGLGAHVDSYDVAPGEDVLSHLLYSVESSDFVLLLIPSEPSDEAKWIRRELDKSLRYKIKSRNVSVIPVYVGRRPLVAPFTSPVSFTLDPHGPYSTTERQIDRIADYVRNVPRVDFERLTPPQFEELIYALLQKLHLFDVSRVNHPDLGFDMEAKSRVRTPFGGYSFITWLIEVKFRRSSRVDIHLLDQLSTELEKYPIEMNGVVITNGQLTSTAREWLEDNARTRRTSMTVVDGTQLRELVLKYPELVDTFFQ